MPRVINIHFCSKPHSFASARHDVLNNGERPLCLRAPALAHALAPDKKVAHQPKNKYEHHSSITRSGCFFLVFALRKAAK